MKDIFSKNKKIEGVKITTQAPIPCALSQEIQIQKEERIKSLEKLNRGTLKYEEMNGGIYLE